MSQSEKGENSEPRNELLGKVESWRNRLLDIGNRNPLISTSFSPTRGVLQIVHPVSEAIWQNLILFTLGADRS